MIIAWWLMLSYLPVTLEVNTGMPHWNTWTKHLVGGCKIYVIPFSLIHSLPLCILLQLHIFVVLVMKCFLTYIDRSCCELMLYMRGRGWMRVSESERDFNVWLEFQQKSIIILMLLSFHVTKAIVFFLCCLLFWEWDLYIWSCSLSPGVSTFLFFGSWI